MNLLNIVVSIIPYIICIGLIGTYISISMFLLLTSEALCEAPSLWHFKNQRGFWENMLRNAEIILTTKEKWICFVPIFHLYLFIAAYLLCEVSYVAVTVRRTGNVGWDDIASVLPNALHPSALKASNKAFHKMLLSNNNEHYEYVLFKKLGEVRHIEKEIKKLFKKFGYSGKISSQDLYDIKSSDEALSDIALQDKKALISEDMLLFKDAGKLTTRIYADEAVIKFSRGSIIFSIYHCRIHNAKDAKRTFEQVLLNQKNTRR